MRLSNDSRAIPGVLFAEDFDDEAVARAEAEPEAAPAAPAPPHVYDADDLAAARESGRDEGRAAARAELEAAAEAERNALLSAIARALDAQTRDASAAAESAIHAIGEAIFAVLGACLPALAARHGEAEVQRAIRMIVKPLLDEPELVVTVGPRWAALATAELATLATSRAEIRVEASAAFGPADVAVRWQHGEAGRDTRAIRRRVLALLRNAVPREMPGDPPPSPEEVAFEETGHGR